MRDPVLIEIINTALNTERQRRGLPNDAELARALDVSSKTLSLWRNGKSLSKAVLILVKLVARTESTP